MTLTRTLVRTILGLGLLAGLAACGDNTAPPQQTQAQANTPAAQTPNDSGAAVAPPATQAPQGETRPRHRHTRRGSRSDRAGSAGASDSSDSADDSSESANRRAGRAGRLGRGDRDDRRVGAAFAAGPIGLGEAQREKVHGRLVEFDGRVSKVLDDDRKGLQHQRFIVTADGAGTILIAHNIDLAGHVPVVIGSTVRVHGLFEWNAKGGVVHWTHHDPSGKTPGGWIRCGGKTYS
ncbi:MAG: DUF3465 domain-containing protein [Acidobacteriota bacterium]